MLLLYHLLLLHLQVQHNHVRFYTRRNKVSSCQVFPQEMELYLLWLLYEVNIIIIIFFFFFIIIILRSR